MRIYGNGLMKLPVKICVTLSFIALMTVSVYGMTKTDQNFDPYAYGLKDSAFTQFTQYRDKAYSNSFDISVICDTPLNYSDPKVQREYMDLDKVAASNGYVKKTTINWMTEFVKYANKTGESIEGDENFYSQLIYFMAENNQFFMDIQFADDVINVSRMIMFGGEDRDSLFLRDEMITLRNDLKVKSKLPVYAISMSYIYTEQFVVILDDTIRNIAITSAAIFIITFPYLIDPRIGLLVFSSFISIILELLAFMYYWHISLNSLSMIIIVMAIGFTVDYSAHIAHAFNISKSETAEMRVVDALESMGTSVLMGGISTFVGICVTGFANSGIFRVFFKMVFCMVVLGLLHGLVFLPVLLTIFCREKNSSVKSAEDDSKNSMKKVGENTDVENNKLRYNETPSCSYELECSSNKGIEISNVAHFKNNAAYDNEDQEEDTKYDDSEKTDDKEEKANTNKEIHIKALDEKEKPTNEVAGDIEKEIADETERSSDNVECCSVKNDSIDEMTNNSEINVNNESGCCELNERNNHIKHTNETELYKLDVKTNDSDEQYTDVEREKVEEISSVVV